MGIWICLSMSLEMLIRYLCSVRNCVFILFIHLALVWTQSQLLFDVLFSGDEFLMPLQAFFCSLCYQFSKDNAHVEAHLKSAAHNNKFKVSARLVISTVTGANISRFQEHIYVLLMNWHYFNFGLKYFGLNNSCLY